MGKWEDAVKAECVDPDSFEEVPEGKRHAGEGIANYLRLSLTIDRKKLLDEHFGDEVAVVLMKNPSTGTNMTSDSTLENLVRYMPRKFGIINCVNITPVVTPDKADLDNSVNTKRLLNNNVQKLNLSKIKSLLSKNTHLTLILATGNLAELPQLGVIYDVLYHEINAIQEMAHFEIKMIRKTKEVHRSTGCHPGYTHLKDYPNQNVFKAYVIRREEYKTNKDVNPEDNPEMFEYPLFSNFNKTTRK